MMGNGKRVLVVENEVQSNDLLVEHLERHRFVPISVGDGLRALRELHRRRFDAVITGRQIPYLNGLALLCQCRLVWPQLPVILLCGDYDDLVWLAQDCGADACLPKPIDPNQVIHVLTEIIAAASASPIHAGRDDFSCA